MSRAFLCVLFASGVLKVVLAIVFADLTPRYDEAEWLDFGRRVLEGAGPVSWRAPGYQWFTALGLWLGAGSFLGVRLLQVAVSIGTSFATYRIGRRVWGERAGLAAGSFVAFYPSHVAFSHLFWSETLYGFLLLVACSVMLGAEEREDGRASFLGGLLLGATALTRSVGVVLLAGLLAWLLFGRRGASSRLRLAAAALAGMLVVVVPWSVRSSRMHGGSIVIDTNGGFNAWIGNVHHIPEDLPSRWSLGLALDNGLEGPAAEFLPDDDWLNGALHEMYADGITDTQGPKGDAWFRARALDEIAAAPGLFVSRIPGKVATLWAPDFFLPRHLLRDWYGITPPWLAALLSCLVLAASFVPLILGPAALAALPPSRYRSLAVWWILAYLAVHTLAYGHTRLHQPLVPLLVLACAGLFSAPGAFDRRRFWRRGVPCAALALALWIYILPVVGGVYVMPGPRHVAAARALGTLRYLPLPSARRPAWMVAGVEASLGRTERAESILTEAPWAELPWTLYLRARLAGDGEQAEALLVRALEREPELFSAWVALARIQMVRRNRARAMSCLKRALELRPWDPSLRFALKAVRAGSFPGRESFR